MATQIVRAPKSSLDHSQIRLNTLFRMCASMVVSCSILTAVGLFAKNGFDKVTIGLMTISGVLFLIGLAWWWHGFALYKKLLPHLTDQESLLWREASTRDMRRLLKSIQAGEQKLRVEAQRLFEMASAFPGLQNSRDFQRAVRSLNIRTCEQMLRVEELHRSKVEKMSNR